MNIKDTLHALTGVGDGEGNTSLMRVILFLVVLAILVPKVWFAIKMGTEISFTNTDLETIGLVLGAKLVQNVQESKPPTTPTTPTK